MNNTENNSSKDNLSKKRKSAIILSIVTLLAISFGGSYYITNYLTSSKNNKNNEVTNENVFADNKYLNDNIFITLKTNDTVDMVDNLVNIKKKLNFKEKLTEEELSTELSKEGYILSEKNEQKITYTREKEMKNNKFAANKYYLGEENGYISIFKTDENGNIIEAEKKVYIDSKPITNLPETDQNYIKEHKFSFDSKDDALQKLSEMIS